METTLKINSWPATVASVALLALAAWAFYLDRSLLHGMGHVVGAAAALLLPQAVSRKGGEEGK